MRFKKSIIIMLCAMLVVGLIPMSALAASDDGKEKPDNGKDAGSYSKKDETIYGNLEVDGALKDMYVVNTFRIKEPGIIKDHGDYKNVRNLSNLEDIKSSGNNTLRFQAKEDEFYYQGDLQNKPLPWDIGITYMLDGEEVEPDELAGKSGSLEIRISTSANDKVNPVFFKNYMLQLSLTFDSANFKDIQAPNGTKANAGMNTQVSFTAMPEKEESFITTANVTDFEMDPISISAVPASMPIEDPDLGGVKGEMQSLSDAIDGVNSGVADLNSGISELNDGAASLSSGSSDYLNGINELNQSSGELVNGSASIRDALQQMNKSLKENSGSPDLSEMKALPEGLRTMAKELRNSAAGLDKLKKNYSAAYTQLDKAIMGIPDYQISEKQVNALREKLDDKTDKTVVNQLAETYQQARKAKVTYQKKKIKGVFDSVTGTLKKISGGLNQMANNAESTATKIEKSIANMNKMNGLKKLQEGLSSLSSRYKSFHGGLVDYTGGVSELASSYQGVNAGIQDLANGTGELDNGASELKNGTEKLQEKTNDLPGQMQSEVDKMMDEYDTSDFEAQSFVSDKNEKIDVVQFVLQTEPIEIEEPEETKETDKKAGKGFWDRLMDLFR